MIGLVTKTLNWAPKLWYSLGTYTGCKVHTVNYDLQASVETEIVRHLNYSNALLSGATSGNLHKLQWLQNQFARVVIRVSRRAHAQPSLFCQSTLVADRAADYIKVSGDCIRSTKLSRTVIPDWTPTMSDTLLNVVLLTQQLICFFKQFLNFVIWAWFVVGTSDQKRFPDVKRHLTYCSFVYFH